MMKLVVFCLVGLVSTNISHQLAKNIERNIEKWNSDVACWGRENALKFHTGLLEASQYCSSAPHYNLLKPTNPFIAILSPTNNPFITNPATVKSPFKAIHTNNYFETLADNPLTNNPLSSNPFQSLPTSASNPFQTPSQTPKEEFNIQNWNKLWGNVFNQPSNRGKRDAEVFVETDEEDLQEFLEDFADFKEDIATKMSNLTCVLSQLNMLDSSFQVNMEGYSQDMWTQMDLSQTLAGSDPVWREMVISGYKDCYSIAQTWPEDTLDKTPLTKVFGRHLVFFKCAKKVERRSCLAAQANDWLTTLYGEDPSYNYAQHGLPSNKYQRAALVTKVMFGATSEEEKFVGDFFYGNHHQ